MTIRPYMVLPALESHIVLMTVTPVATATATAAGAGMTGGEVDDAAGGVVDGAGMTGVDVDGAAGGVVDGDVGSRFAVKVDGAGVVEELLLMVGVVAAALEVAGELVEWDHLCWLQDCH